MTPFTDIVIHPLASSNQEEHYLLSYRNQYYEATFPVVELLWELQQKPTREEAVSAYMNKKGGKYTAEQVGQIIEKYIMPLFFTQTRKRTFLYEKELLTASDVDAFSDRLRFMFNKYCMTATFAFTPYLFQIRRKEKYGLLIYALVVNLFMGYYFCYVIPLFLYQFLMSFPEELQELILYLSNNMTPPFALLRNIVMQLLFLSLIVLMIVNLIRSLKRHVR